MLPHSGPFDHRMLLLSNFLILLRLNSCEAKQTSRLHTPPKRPIKNCIIKSKKENEIATSSGMPYGIINIVYPTSLTPRPPTETGMSRSIASRDRIQIIELKLRLISRECAAKYNVLATRDNFCNDQRYSLASIAYTHTPPLANTSRPTPPRLRIDSPLACIFLTIPRHGSYLIPPPGA